MVEKWAKPALGCVIWEDASARQNLKCVFIHVLDYTGIDLHDSSVYFDDWELIPPHSSP